MICDRCGEPIPPGEGERILIHGPSSGGTTIHVHRELCHQPRTGPRSPAPRP